MNLTELQVELRNVENRISQLSAEIEKMKPEKQESKIDYDAITSVAKKYSINELDICHAPKQVCKEFVSMLMYLFVAYDNGLSERLLYLTRLAVGCKLQMNAKDVYQSALAIEMDDVERLSGELADYRYSFVIESFVVANLCVEIDKDAWTLLADIAQLMKCDEEEIVVLSHVAKYKLTGDTRHLDEIPLPKTNRWSGKLREYIPDSWIKSQRKQCGTICIKQSDGNRTCEGLCRVENRLETGIFVNCGQTIISYKKLSKKVEQVEPIEFGISAAARSLCFLKKETERISNILQCEENWEERTIEAVSDGVVFLNEYTIPSQYVSDGMYNVDGSKPRDTYLQVFIVSIFDDFRL